ncbi:hypothetical protein GCM10010172_62050 [Paractinoplanes ferrugineus]|uniref:DUF1345 domain-containing protein n=2 Tax=Paractinoplanes ferrugineus TaxID=113564 RepID=A0A919JBK0_9ACTN|nr:hypothetical protein Afe05nite_84730 [Actinoplanes ferrugineus]
MFDLVFVSACVVTAVAVFLGADENTRIGALTRLLVLTGLPWVALASIWTVIRFRRIRRAQRGNRNWTSTLAGRRTTRVIITSTSFIVLGSGMHIALYRGSDANAVMVRSVSILMVLTAWVMLHLAYTERYARLELENTGEPHLEFPATARPTLLDFTYFAFAIGTTFGTTDVSVRTSHARGVVIGHGLLAFVYNTAILGMALSLLTA